MGNDGHELEVDASVENLSAVIGFLDDLLEEADCPMKAQVQLDVAVEEIYVNIAHYAYAPGTGKARIRVEVGGDPAAATVVLSDSGTPYNPLEKEDPDTGLAADEDRIGGFGIYMTKKTMDSVTYEYRDGQNILTMVKRF